MHDPSARVPWSPSYGASPSWWQHWGCRRIGGWGCWWCSLSQVGSGQACQLYFLVGNSCFHGAASVPAVAAPPWLQVQELVSYDDHGPAAEGVMAHLAASVLLPSQSLWSTDCQLRRGAAPRTQVASGGNCLLAVLVAAPWGCWVVPSMAAATWSSLGNSPAAHRRRERLRAMVV